MNPARSTRSLSTAAVWVSIFAVAEALVAAMVAFSTAGEIQLLDGVRFGAVLPLGQAEAWDSQQRLLAGLLLGLAFPHGVLFLVWIYRANRNARILGAEGMSYSPGWSVGWFFVPLASLVMPCLVMRELWKASSGPPVEEKWRQAPVSPLVGPWWAVGVFQACLHYSPIPVVLGNWKLAEFHEFSDLHRSWVGSLQEFYWGYLLAAIVVIAGVIFDVALMIALTHLQQQRSTLFTSGTEEGREEQPAG